MGDINPIPLVFRIVAALALSVLLIPVLIVVLAGLNSGDYLTFPPEGLSLRWVRTFLTSPTFMPAFLFSFDLALTTSLVVTVVGSMAAVFLTRSTWRGRELLRGLFILPVVLPGVVLGLALYVFFIWTGSELARTFPGHLLVTIPFVIATVSASLVDFDPSLEEAARSLGPDRSRPSERSPFRSSRRASRRASSSPSSSALVSSSSRCSSPLLTASRCRSRSTRRFATPSNPRPPPQASSRSASSSCRRC